MTAGSAPRRSALPWLAAVGTTLLVAAFLLLPASAAAQRFADEGTVLTRVEKAFASGNARALMEPASERVEISLFGTSTQYSRSQAAFVLRDFFDEHPPRGYAFENVSETEGSRYAAGHYWYKGGGGTPLRVYVRLSQNGEEEWAIREIRVERRG